MHRGKQPCQHCFKRRKSITRKPCNKVHIYIIKAAFFASSNASTVCSRGMAPADSVQNIIIKCLQDLFDIPATLAFFNAISLSCVTVSGLPASTVYSRKADKSKLSLITSKSFLSCKAERVVGVPARRNILFQDANRVALQYALFFQVHCKED